MKREFKFRHADEIAGTFVICAVALLVAGIVFAGRSQGWFEGKFNVNVVFNTAEGSFGLQEGAIVQVRNTVAGRVGKIVPTEGGLGTTLIIKERFQPFITKDAVAKIKKKFGVAGDSYVEIERGSGLLIEDGDTIKCLKDEEVMETAQKMLSELETTLLPMFEEVEKIVASVSSILASVEKGEGIAGAAVSDPELRDDLTAIVAHFEAIAADAETAVEHAGGLLTNEVNSLVKDVTAMTHQTRELMSSDVGQLIEEVHALQQEAVKTLRESRKLIIGVQQHWFFRKYVKEGSQQIALLPSSLEVMADSTVKAELEESLSSARAGDDNAAIARDAFNLAVCALANGDREGADVLNTEARIAARAAGVSSASCYLLDAELARMEKRFDDAIAAVGECFAKLEKNDRETAVEAQVLLGAIYTEKGSLDKAEEALDRADKINRKLDLPVFAAAVAGSRADIALRQGELNDAAGYLTRKAELLRSVLDLKGIAKALQQAGDVYMTLEKPASAAIHYYRAANSLVAQDDVDAAAKLLVMAEAPAIAAGDDMLLKRIRQLKQQIN